MIVLIKELKEDLKKYVSEQFKDIGLTSSQWMLMGVLMKNGNMKITDLSRRLGLSNSTVSGIIDRLEKQGYVTRKRDEKDKRKVFIEITDKFKKTTQKSHIDIQKKVEEKLSKISDKEINKIIEGLKLLKKIFQGE
ncbi:MarR family transcriptional regulator [Marinitoga sp. 1155]|nr:MarR family transcriptional regulator [Marinitoga sp. 1155]